MRMHPFHPSFTSARGTIHEWSDPHRSFLHRKHWEKRRDECSAIKDQEMLARDPNYEQWIRDRNPPYCLPATWEEVRHAWRPMNSVYEVWVVPPDFSRETTMKPTGDCLIPTGEHVVNPHYRASSSFDPTMPMKSVMPYKHYAPDDYDAYCYGPHSRGALALLQPACFFHGREPRDARQPVTFLGREAELVPLRAIIPLTDPRMLGDELNPAIFHDTDECELIVDNERGVILEWRALFEGEVYERHFFTEIAFDEPADEAIFYPEGPNPKMVKPSF